MKKLMFVIGFLVLSNISFPQWTQTDGIYGGTVFSIAIDGQNIFAGVRSTGVYLSTNGGNTWQQKLYLRNTYVKSLAVSGNNVFAGCDSDSGIFRSTDYGQTWIRCNLVSNTVHSLAFSGSNILAGCQTPNCVYASTDNGVTWQTVISGHTGFALTVSGSYAFAGTGGSGIYKSTNNGLNWTQTTINSGEYHSVYSNGSNIYAMKYVLFPIFLDTCFYVYSTNYGSTWSKTSNNFSEANAVTVNGTNIFAGCANDSGLYRSTNNGLNWEKQIGNCTIFSLANSSSNTFAGVGEYGILKSTNYGVNWSEVGINCKFITSIISSNTNLFASTSKGTVYKSTNNGLNWLKTNLANTGCCSMYSIGSTILTGCNRLFGNDAGGIYISTNSGENWIKTYNNTSGFCFTSCGTKLFSGIEGGVIISTNGGLNWSQTSLTSNIVFSLATSDTILFAGTQTNGILKSTNNGLNWSFCGLSGQMVLSLAVNGQNIFAGTALNGVYRSTNSGITWSQTPLVSNYIAALGIIGRNIFASTTANGIFLSTNNGDNWISANEGFTRLPDVRTFLIKDNYIFAGVYGRSVWRRQLSELIGVQNISTDIPDKYSLSQNYPNPFNPSTNIRYSIPAIVNRQSSIVRLVVFDILGKEIATLVNEKQQPGTYEVTFDASGLTSGVYFYKLTAGDFSETKKMLMIK